MVHPGTTPDQTELRSDRTPVTTVAELETLDAAEIVEGFMDGYKGEPEPGDNRSKAYWHGYSNAMRDRAHGPPDPAGIALVRDMRQHGYFAPSAKRTADEAPGMTT